MRAVLSVLVGGWLSGNSVNIVLPRVSFINSLILTLFATCVNDLSISLVLLILLLSNWLTGVSGWPAPRCREAAPAAARD